MRPILVNFCPFAGTLLVGRDGCLTPMIFHVLDVELSQNGDGIVIGKVERFAAEVLPKYYKHSNYQSFVRQV